MALTLASSTRGLIEVEFWEHYGRVKQCRSSIAEMCWRDGFNCPSCDQNGHAHLKNCGHWQYIRCKRQVSVTAGKKPRRLQLNAVKGARMQGIAKLAKSERTVGTKVESDV